LLGELLNAAEVMPSRCFDRERMIERVMTSEQR
jgi:hypothetical protein